jgi:hypothetical protein
MKIMVERSGGVTGISASYTVDAGDLPPNMISKIRRIVDERSSLPLKTIKAKGMADHYNFKITVEDGSKKDIIRCNQYDLQNDLKSIVSFVEKYSKKRS